MVMKLGDWFIMLSMSTSVMLLIGLAYRHPDPMIVGAVCGAVPAILGFHHWFFVRDQKQPDAQ